MQLQVCDGAPFLPCALDLSRLRTRGLTHCVWVFGPAVLIDMGERRASLPTAAFLPGVCAYLDVVPPSLNLPSLHRRAWTLVLSRLSSAASLAADRHAALAQSIARVQDASNDPALTAFEVDAAAETLVDDAQSAQAALADWHGAASVLAQRAWWLTCHLDIPPGEEVASLIEAGKATVESLGVLAALHTALHVIGAGSASPGPSAVPQWALFFDTHCGDKAMRKWVDSRCEPFMRVQR